MPDNERLEADLCIVGAGPAGLAIARTLAGRGPRICVIESGGPEPEQEASVRDLSYGRNIGLNYFRLDDARGRGLGGSGTRWNIPMSNGAVGVRLRPLEPIDFEARDWLPNSGWPFDYAHLEPYYARAAALCNIEAVSPSADECARRDGAWPLPLDRDIVQTAMFQIGPASAWWGQETISGISRAGVTVLVNGTVTQIDSQSDAQAVTGVRVGTLTGRTIRVDAKIVVLACGGIDNARLLLLSDEVVRGGLGNGHDLVGRYFMEHPHLLAGVLIPSQTEVFEKAARYQVKKSGASWVEGRLAIAEPTARREQLRGCVVALHALPRKGALRGLEMQENPTGGEVAASLMISAMERRVWPYDARKLLREIAADPMGVSRALRRQIERKRRLTGNQSRGQHAVTSAPPEVFALNVMSEQEPHPDSRVLLDRRHLDAFGQPRAALDWRVRDADIRAITRSLDLIGRQIEAAGLGRFHTPLHPTLPPHRLKGGYHHMGTTRMHTDPRKGVVDADCRVHGISNLYIAGSSVFPTGGYANPTLTVVALAVRLADRLALRFSKGTT
ncbi:MAG: FAD-dependent oxidoreductase [Gammaproteobacteria bacterium]